MSADRFISDVSNGLRRSPLREQWGVRRSVHFRRQQQSSVQRDRERPKCPPIGSFPTSATFRGLGQRDLRPGVRRSVHFRRQQLLQYFPCRKAKGVRRSVHFRRQQPPSPSRATESIPCPPIGSFPTSATWVVTWTRTRPWCVRRSVHFRRQQPAEVVRMFADYSCPPIGSFPTSATDDRLQGLEEGCVSADRFISDVSNTRTNMSDDWEMLCPPIGSFPTSATPSIELFAPPSNVSADRFISDVSNSTSGGCHFDGSSVRRSVHFRRQQPAAEAVLADLAHVSADRFISDVSNMEH